MVRILLLLSLLLPGYASIKAGNPWGVDYSLFAVKPHSPGRSLGSLYEKLDGIQGSAWAITHSMPLTRSSGITIGAGYRSVDFQRETQGIFPETGQYGFVSVNGKLNYWIFPVSWAVVSRGTFGRSYGSSYLVGLRILYIPSFIHHSSFEVNSLGGGVQSAYAGKYTNQEQHFQHALLFSVTNQVFLSRKTKLVIDPYIGMGSAFFRSAGNIFNDIQYGIRFSFHFTLPQISIELQPDPNKNLTKKQLEQKQKEIEDQLHNKPR
jgi:hypothetical protein